MESIRIRGGGREVEERVSDKEAEKDKRRREK